MEALDEKKYLLNFYHWLHSPLRGAAYVREAGGEHWSKVIQSQLRPNPLYLTHSREVMLGTDELRYVPQTVQKSMTGMGVEFLFGRWRSKRDPIKQYEIYY
jgi:hypothetical protein